MEVFETTLEPVAVSDEMKHAWKIMASWAKFFSIAGFILIGFLALYMLFLVVIGSRFILQNRGGMGNDSGYIFGLIIGGILVPLLGIVWGYFIHIRHLRFANQVQLAIRANDQDAFEKAWKNLRDHFRYYGISVIIGLSLLAIIIAVQNYFLRY